MEITAPKGLHTRINTLIKEQQEEDDMVIERDAIIDKLQEECDKFQMTNDPEVRWAFHDAFAHAVAVDLQRAGYKSVNDKLYVNTRYLNLPNEYKERLTEKAEGYIEDKKKALRDLKAIFLYGENGTYFDVGENGETVIKVASSLDEVIKTLKKKRSDA